MIECSKSIKVILLESVREIANYNTRAPHLRLQRNVTTKSRLPHWCFTRLTLHTAWYFNVICNRPRAEINTDGKCCMVRSLLLPEVLPTNRDDHRAGVDLVTMVDCF